LALLAANVKPALASAVLLTAKRVAKTGFSLGQEVVFHVMGEDYVCNYAKGYVLGITKPHDVEGLNLKEYLIVVEGREGYTATLRPESLLSVDAWETHLARLLRSRRINDPDGGLRHIDSKLIFGYSPPLHAGNIKPPIKAKRTKKAPRRVESISLAG
jgi:hypothetical protein